MIIELIVYKELTVIQETRCRWFSSFVFCAILLLDCTSSYADDKSNNKV